MKRASWMILVGAILVGLLRVGSAAAQEASKYPTKGIDIIVPVSAGGTPDVMTRLTSEWLSKYWGKPVTVINKPGGGAIPGALEVLNAAPDGYTVGTITSQNTSQQHGANKKPPIDVTNPTYLTRVFDVDLVLTVNAKSEWTDIKSFSKWAVANPDKLVWANTGAVSTAAFATAEWYAKLGGDISKTRMMSTGGGAESATLLAGGNCVMNFGDFLGSAAMVRAGKVRYLATSAKKRSPYFPDVPTMEENGIAGLTVGLWVGFMMPHATPEYVIKAWDAAIQKMITDEGFLKKLTNVAGRTAYMNAADFRKLIMQESETYTALAEKLGVRK